MVCYSIFWIGQSCIEYTEHVAMILLTDHPKNSFPERNFQCPKQPLLNQLYIIAVYTVKEPCFCLSGSSQPFPGSSRIFKTQVIWASPSHIALAIWVGVRVTGDADITVTVAYWKTRRPWGRD